MRAEFGDLIFLIYTIVLIRQWVWGLSNELAWPLTITSALLCWLFYISRKETQTGTGLPFWLIVGIPLLFAFALRMPFPDSSFDVWSLRLFHGDRGLLGFIYLPDEFFPTAAPFNPTPDMVTGIFRHVLGYRLGTVVNLLVLLWAGSILDRLLRPMVANSWLRAATVLLCLWAEHLLFEINNYMPDLLALPLLLEATRITIENNRVFERRRVVRVAFLLGLAMAFKLSNAATIVPLVLIWSWRGLQAVPNLKQLAPTTVTSLLVFAAPLIPFSVWVYKLTGSPTFPIYNGVFRSPFYPPFNGWDDRWGGYGAFEILLWPLLMFFSPERTSELPVYSGRLTLGFLLAILCLCIWRQVARLRLFSLIILVGTFLWSLTMGYIRYGLFLEVLSGLLIVTAVAHLYSSQLTSRWRQLLAMSLLILLVVQSTFASIYLFRMEWSMRPTVLERLDSSEAELKYVLHDRSTQALLTPNEKQKFDNVEVWIVSGAKTPSLMLQLNDRARFIGVRYLGLLLTVPSREWLQRSLAKVEGKEMWSMAVPSDYGEAVFALRNAGLEVGSIETMLVPFHAPITKVQVYFFEVLRRDSSSPPLRKTQGQASLGPDGYRARLTLANPKTSLKPGEEVTLFVRIENLSNIPWPAQGQADNTYRVNLWGTWTGRDLETNPDTGLALLPYDLGPGESTVVPLSLKAPLLPGQHNLEIGLVQEGVTLFKNQGSAPINLTVLVEF